MLSSNAIRSKLMSLISEQLSVDEFDDWIAVNSWNMHVDADPIAQALASAIELRLAEYSSGHLPWQQMVDEFRALLGGFVVLNVRLNADPFVRSTGSSIRLEEVARVQAPNAGKSPLTVYA